jgi:ParB family transcriptional regulator, chromosome partitioning protein
LESARSVSEEIVIGDIVEPSFKVRVNPGDIVLLAASIRSEGLLEPIVVRPRDDKFEVVAGARRLAACKSLGWRKIPCQVMEMDNQEALSAAIAENVARQTLDPIEEARSFEEYTKRYGWGSQTDLAKRIGKSPYYVSRRLRLLKLPQEDLQELLRRHNNPSLITELLAVQDPKLRDQMIELSGETEITSKDLRRMRKMTEKSSGTWTGSESNLDLRNRRVKNAIQKSVVSLRIALHRMDNVFENLGEDDWILREILLQQRQALHSQIDLFINLMKKVEKRPM